VLQDFTLLLDVEGCFAGMSWHDARHAATVMLCAALHRDDATEFLRARAERVLDGTDNLTRDDREAMARALTTAADVLGL